MQISFLKILPENALKFVSKKMRICVKNFAQLHEETWKDGEQAGRTEGRAEEIIAAGYEFGLSEKTILERLQKKLAITPQQAQEYLATYTKETEQRC